MSTAAPRPRRRPRARLFTNVMLALPVLATLAWIGWVVVFGGAEAREIYESFRVKAGAPAPNFALRDVKGEATTLRRVTGDVPTLVVVMDPRCPHCHTEIESVRSILAELRGGAPRVVLVSAGDSATLPEAAAKYPELPLYDDYTGALDRLGLKMVPALFTVHPDGRVRDVRVGVQTPQYLRSVLTTLSPRGA
ncbi:MAG TPA: TlpA disulfide reductase family protein [Longimicrobium sp.]|nr:TlpA disulfide reductase family protein [Longimicrobium sp.]